jgi:hypothetical protein
MIRKRNVSNENKDTAKASEKEYQKIRNKKMENMIKKTRDDNREDAIMKLK